MVGDGTANYLRTDVIIFLRIIVGDRIQEVREEKYTQDAEHDKQLNENKQPKRFADGHTLETIYVKSPNFYNQVLHGIFNIRYLPH